MPPQTPSSRAWGNPADKPLRPGVNGDNPDGSCTTNFLYHLNDTRYFLGLAAHCFRTDGNPAWISCPTSNAPLGTRVQFFSDDGRSWGGSLAYSSFLSMQRVHEQDASICDANDLALVELDADTVQVVHPAVRGFGGPTGLAAGALADGAKLYMYGNSETRSAFGLAPTGVGNEHTGNVDSYADGGWRGVTSFTPAAIPGDSGSGLMGPAGEAAGVLSVVSSDGSNGFANLPFALWYMAVHEGWWPSVVTWPTFDPNGNFG
jgi:hypothetical protein